MDARAEQVEKVGRAIHAAKRVGGPWGPACGYVDWDHTYKEANFVLVEYDDNTKGDGYDCECAAMASHLVELMEG